MESSKIDVAIDQASCELKSKKRSSTYLISAFSLSRGEQLSLVGKSGSGKSSLLNLVAGFLPAQSGSVTVCGTELQGLSEGKRDLHRRKNLGMVFQTYQLLEEFTVLENVRLGGYFSEGGERGDEEVESLLEQVGLAPYMDRLPAELSVGQRQRVSIARALLKKPQLILADEPTGALDDETGGQVCDLLQRLCEEEGRSLIFVTHDRDLAARFPRQEKITNLISWQEG